MRLPKPGVLRLGAFALSAVAANAFQDTSPFVFFSTSEILASSPQIATASSVFDTISKGLESCPSDVYVIVSQPGVGSIDYQSSDTTSYLRKFVSGENKQIRSGFTVSEVLGAIDTSALASALEKRCRAGLLSVDASTGEFEMIDGMRPRVIKVDFPALGKDRTASLYDNDNILYDLINILPSPNYSVIYTTTPVSLKDQQRAAEPAAYEMDDMMSSLPHMDLKRDTSAHSYAGNRTNEHSLPLFQKYTFFTPGIFMGLVVSFILVMILYVAITAVASIQVSYAAFDKENGPAAQKKQ